MPISDAFIVSDDWISESYFTSDATKQSYLARVIERRKDWEARKADLGESPLTRFGAVRGELASLIVSAIDESTHAAARADASLELTELLHRTLGYCDRGRAQRRVGPITWVRSTDVDTEVIALVDAAPADSLEDLLSKETGRLTEPWLAEDGKEIALVVPRALSSIFADADAPAYAVVFAARWVLVAERTRWAEGRYLAIDLQLVVDRNEIKRGGEIDSALAAVHADSFVPEADGSVWWNITLEDSIKHTVGVSKDLREGIRLSIEDIANEVVRRRDLKGLEPLPDDQAQPLALQSLRFLYRILFLLFAEASPELEVLPTSAADYDKGYSLDRLRELVQVKIDSPKAKNGTHFYDSLAVLFRLVDSGHTPPRSDIEHDALTFNALRADLFSPESTAHINEVCLGNEVLQGVLDRLLLSKKQNNKQRGFISYAELGINQLGAVYEGLMSYTGFFASEPLYEVAPNGDPSKGSWVVPVARIDSDTENGEDWIEPHFVKRDDEITGSRTPVKHDRGEFVFRLAGRERQQSASYYTPEVLTRFTVSQALEELLDQNDVRTSAEDILAMTVCEPALGSGAFAIEAVRQLAEAYLIRRQEELGVRVDPEEYTRELQRVKAYIALHQVYGVDLNGTAVELAEISLWLDTMAPGLAAPWFGLHLQRGNSLIGARRAVYSPTQLANKSWLKSVPRDVPLNDPTGTGGGIHHFLLPAAGWGSTAVAKEGKDLAPEDVLALRAWRRAVTGALTKKQVEELASLAKRVEVLWDLARRRLEIANREVRRAIPVWGRETETAGVVAREQIETSLADQEGAYRRLRRIMDAWNALWFWPLTEVSAGGVTPPTVQQWTDACRMILGRSVAAKPAAARHGQASLGAGQSWTELGVEEVIELGFAGCIPVDDVLDAHPWLRVCERVAEEQGFFHWELDFAPIFETGGFDLQVGNPPWVRPDLDEVASLGELDVWWAVLPKQSEEISRARRTTLLADSVNAARYLRDITTTVAMRERLSDPVTFPLLTGLRPDLYRSFMDQVWRASAGNGVAALIHQESHFTDEKALHLREATYRRLRRHWQFFNELKLFEIQNQKSFSVNVYGARRDSVAFLNASSLYHPSTVEGSLRHSGEGVEFGSRDEDGHWDLRPHSSRIGLVDDSSLRAWAASLDFGGPYLQTKMIHVSGKAAEAVLARGLESPRAGAFPVEYSSGWIEGTDNKTGGTFDQEWGQAPWEESILQGTFLHVHRPFYRYPNQTLKNNRDNSPYDLESLRSDELPITAFKPIVPLGEFTARYNQRASGQPFSSAFRIAWRAMADNVGRRTLMCAIIPPGPTHVHGIGSLALTTDDPRQLLILAALLGSLQADFFVRAAPKSTIPGHVISRIPAPSIPRALEAEAIARVLRLNALTHEWAPIYDYAWPTNEHQVGWSVSGLRLAPLGGVLDKWSRAVPLRTDEERYQAEMELDVIAAISLRLGVEDLLGLYRSQFPVLFSRDAKTVFNGSGRAAVGRAERTTMSMAVAAPGGGGEAACLSQQGLQRPLDRSADMRLAYSHFQRVVREHS